MSGDREPLTELEFRLTEDVHPFVSGSAAASCQCVLRELLPRSDGEYLEFFEVRDGSPAEIRSVAAEAPEFGARVLVDRDDGGVVEIRVRDPSACIATTLADRGAYLRDLWAESGEGRIVAELTSGQDPAGVVASVTDEYPSADLVAKRERPPEGAFFARERVRTAIDERLTDRQREVLVSAYLSGYFERPRETTGSDLAAELDISAATVSQHLRAAQRKVLDELLEDGLVSSTVDAT